MKAAMREFAAAGMDPKAIAVEVVDASSSVEEAVQASVGAAARGAASSSQAVRLPSMAEGGDLSNVGAFFFDGGDVAGLRTDKVKDAAKEPFPLRTNPYTKKGGNLSLMDYIKSMGTGDKKSMIWTAVINMPVTLDVLTTWSDAGIYVPFNVMLMRPFIEHRMYSAILAKSGYDTGATYFGHSDFQLGDDVVTKVHYGNFTFYSKAVITNPKNVMIAENIMAGGYIGGNNATFFEDKAQVAARLQGRTSAMNGSLLGTPSIIAVLLPVSEEITQTPISMLSDTTLNKSSSDALLNLPEGYSQAKFVEEYWGLNASYFGAPAAGDKSFFHAPSKANKVLYQGHQFSADYEDVVICNGHRGPEQGPGIADAWAGMMKTVPAFNWAGSSKAHGVYSRGPKVSMPAA